MFGEHWFCTDRNGEEKSMAVKVGESWVSEAALEYAKGKSVEDGKSTLDSLSKQYPGVNFSTNIAPFSQNGVKNIQIAPNILAQMQNDPEKRLEYEALIYDCATGIDMLNHSGGGFHTKAAGFIINPDGSLGGWSISVSDDDGKQNRNRVSLDKNKKETWAEKIRAEWTKKRDAEKKEEKIRIKKEMEEKQIEKNIELSERAKDLLNELKSKYKDMDFIVADYGSEEEAQKYLSRGTKRYSVLISPDLLEKMANDEESKEKYMGIIDGATEKIQDVKEKLGDDIKNVKNIGFTIREDGEVSFFAELEKMSEKQKERIEKSREEKAEKEKDDKKQAEKAEKEKVYGRQTQKSGNYGNLMENTVKRVFVEADSVESLAEKIHQTDWNSIEETKMNTHHGSRFDYSV